MNNIVWKKFKLEDVFNFGSFDLLNESLKQLNTSSIKDDTHTIAVVTQSGRNNGVVGYVEPTTNIVSKQVQNAYTFSNNFGICFYHNYEFVIPANNAISLIEPATDNLKYILNNSIYNALFFATIIHKICCKSMYNYMWKPSTDRVKREYILLPCIECSKEESIWEEDNKYYTLAVEYIESLMKRAKERREENTIKKYEAERKKYEAERKKYEAERKKYEAEYLIEKPNVIWKKFNIIDIFNIDNPPTTNTSQKDLNIETEPFDNSIPLVTRAEKNNGVVGYIDRANWPTAKKGITYNSQFGLFLYHNYEFTTIKVNMHVIHGIQSKLQNIMDENDYINYFFVRILNSVFSEFFGFGFSSSGYKFEREIILLPCIECNKEDSIWKENGKYYTLPINYISYIYLSGRIEYCQKLIDNYTYKY